MTGQALLAVRGLELHLFFCPNGRVHSHRSFYIPQEKNESSSTDTVIHEINVHVLEQTHTVDTCINPFHPYICRNRRQEG